jgi:hypothetical protein
MEEQDNPRYLFQLPDARSYKEAMSVYSVIAGYELNVLNLKACKSIGNRLARIGWNNTNGCFGAR